MRVNVVPKQDIFTPSREDRSLQAYGLMDCFASKQDAQKACDTLLTDEEWNQRKITRICRGGLPWEFTI